MVSVKLTSDRRTLITDGTNGHDLSTKPVVTRSGIIPTCPTKKGCYIGLKSDKSHKITVTWTSDPVDPTK